ncbi:MAG: hypothetical protein H0U76_13420 [Ktedonobacteraceae bacterium]|nr:hypothetical protein [Ktedonobacteraceae bacterium]
MTELIDNDILLKGSCYGLLHDLMAANCQSMPVGYLAVAKFVVGKKLKKMKLRGELAQAVSVFNTFLSSHEAIEPTSEEAALASELEATAQAQALPLDTGESQLLAILATRGATALFTGDKRAIMATERLLDCVPILAAVVGKMKCLEQLLKQMLEGNALDAIRGIICGEPDVDRALTIFFQCFSSCVQLEDTLAALDSYINDLRRSSPKALFT